MLFQIPQRYRFSSKSQLRCYPIKNPCCCFRYHKGTDFQANHNTPEEAQSSKAVVLDTTKVQIFKQITTNLCYAFLYPLLFQIPQRYRFSSKSQPNLEEVKKQTGCFRYHKGTDFQANHNYNTLPYLLPQLFQIPQRYRFSSKSQRIRAAYNKSKSCFRYHKGTDFQANHNNACLIPWC